MISYLRVGLCRGYLRVVNKQVYYGLELDCSGIFSALLLVLHRLRKQSALDLFFDEEIVQL